MFDSNLLIIYTLSFMDLLAVGLIFPVFQAHLISLGVSKVFIGALGSTYATIQVLSGPIVGSWSDIRGRKPVIVTTLLLCSLCYFLLGVTDSIYFIFALRILLGLFKHTQTICKAYIVDLYDSSKHAAILGQSSAYGALGFVIGPVIGGHLFELTHGFFYITSLTSLLFIFNTVIALKVSTKQSKKRLIQTSNKPFTELVISEVKSIGKELKNIKWTAYWDVFLMRICFGLTVTIFFSNQSLFVQSRFSLSQKYVGYLIAFLSCGGVLAGLFLGRIKTKFYKNDDKCLDRIWQHFLSTSISFLGLSASTSVYAYLLFALPFAISNIILRNATMESIINRSDLKNQGSLSGVSNSLMSISRSVSPLLVSVIASFYGDESIMFIALIPSVCGMILSLTLKYKDNLLHKHVD